MKKPFIYFSLAVMAFTCLISGFTNGKPCADDHHGLRGKCRYYVVNGQNIYYCGTAVDLKTDCTYYVQ
ncbi:hypothetical protein ECE50_000100 [Chitinophaga sp. Mgbs1]|uniref:Uncharacterized protein n=1 Tax=Chitinophaga solisilvae TaxID=1233460 RepID=A0A433WDU4_9BACT|nr:hypothetical protein [Chitinophaga solisilvae]